MSMSDGGNSLLGSDDMNPVGDNDDDLDDQFNLDHFESDDEDMSEQDLFKGRNLSSVAVVKQRRGDMTVA